MKSYGSIYKFLRNRDEIKRRQMIAAITYLTSDKSDYYHFSTREVVQVLSRAGLDVKIGTVRKWIREELLPAYKKSKKRYAKWWVTKRQLIRFQKRMAQMSKEYEDIRAAVEFIKKTRHHQYVREEEKSLPRDRQGRFITTKPKTYDHEHMTPRLG